MKVFTTPPLKVLKVTDKAVLFDRENDEPFWIPKSQIEDPDVEELQVNTEQEITIPYWLAQEKDLV